MRARAPGKIVLSGAYAVLEGAPALVAAVDRYVTADGARPAERITAEVQAAIDRGTIDRAAWFDAMPLRTPLPDGGSRKLGLGSSAAITVATIAAITGDPGLNAEALAAAVFPEALAAHRLAQPRGSGIDVAASAFGGVVRARIQANGALAIQPHPLPAGTVIEVFACPDSASTDDLVGRVQAFASEDPSRYRRLINAAIEGAREAAAASTIDGFQRGLDAQLDALEMLGQAAGAAIVTPEVKLLRAVTGGEGAYFGPSGAGGGDIAIFVGARPPSDAVRAFAARQGFEALTLVVGAAGVTIEGATPRG